MPHRSLDSDSGLIPDPKQDPIPWRIYGLGLAGFGLLVAGWWAGSNTTGVLRVSCRVLGVLGGAYGINTTVLAAGWQVFSRFLEGRMARARLRSAKERHESLLEFRFGRPQDDRPPFVDAFFDSVNAELGGAGNCEAIETSGGGAVTFYFHGHDLDRMVTVVRQVAAQFPLPSDAYVWLPSQATPGFGTVLSVRQE